MSTAIIVEEEQRSSCTSGGLKQDQQAADEKFGGRVFNLWVRRWEDGIRGGGLMLRGRSKMTWIFLLIC